MLKHKTATFIALCFLVFQGTLAQAETVYPSMAETAIPVENTMEVPLISITRAADRLIAVGAHGVIVFSDNDGKSWIQARVPVNVVLTAVAFATPREGWAAGDEGVILHTSDGGDTWQLQLTGPQVNQLMMAEAQQYIIANPATEAAARAIRRANIFVQAGADKPFLTILPLGPMKAIVFGSYRMAVVTDDGGKTWHDMSLQIADPISHNIYGLAQSGQDVYLALETGLVLRSTDGGTNFLQLAQPGDVTLFGIVATKAGTLLAYGVAGSLFRSADSGTTWTPINIDTSFNLTAARSLPTGTVVITSESGEVFVSKNDGLTFQRTSAAAGMEVYDFQPTADGKFAYVGNLGVRILDAP